MYDGACSEPFPITSGVKQGCVLAPTLFSIFFSLLLTYAIGSSDDGVYLHTRSDGCLFNMARLRSKTKATEVLIREMLSADDVALQRLIDRFAYACREFGLAVEDGRIPKDIMYEHLAIGSRPVGCPALRFKDVCKRDMKACDISPADWEVVAEDRDRWRQAVREGIRQADEKRSQKAAEKRDRRKRSTASTSSQPSNCTCTTCSRDCHSRIGLYSHSRRCSATD